MRSFCDLPHDTRIALRFKIADAGGCIASYTAEGIDIMIPRPVGPFYRAMEAIGLVTVGHGWYFPLGSDQYPDHLRHDASYPGSRGFTLTGSFTLSPELLALIEQPADLVA